MNDENGPQVVCSDCGKDITLEVEYYDCKGHIYCEQCNLNYDCPDYEA